MTDEPVAQGSLLVVPARADTLLPTLAKETASILRALRAPAEARERVPPEADFVLVLVEEGSDVGGVALPDLKDRAAAAVAVAGDAPEGRVAVAGARKRLRQQGAFLSPRELVLSPEQFGVMGLESDGARERLEILLRALVHDAERLRLKREGWEEP